MTKIKEKTDIFALAVVQWENCTELGYCNLVDAVRNLHLQSHQAAVKAINRYATMRNWLIGFFIVEYSKTFVILSLNSSVLSGKDFPSSLFAPKII